MFQIMIKNLTLQTWIYGQLFNLLLVKYVSVKLLSMINSFNITMIEFQHSASTIKYNCMIRNHYFTQTYSFLNSSDVVRPMLLARSWVQRCFKTFYFFLTICVSFLRVKQWQLFYFVLASFAKKKSCHFRKFKHAK